MQNEYSVAYTLTSEEDLTNFTNDFMLFFRSLPEQGNLAKALEPLPKQTLDYFEASHLKETHSFPESWLEAHTELLKSLESGEIKCADIDSNFAHRSPEAAFEASYTQAFFLLALRKLHLDRMVFKPKKHVPFVYSKQDTAA